MKKVSTVSSYAEAFRSQEPVKVQGLCGRIIRGKRPADFRTLTDDPHRKLVMLMASDGLQLLPGKTGYEMLTAIGYTCGHIADKVGKGLLFKLAVFPEGRNARPATWNNLLAMMGEAYPATAKDLKRHVDELKRTPFKEIEQQAGYSFVDVEAAGPADERFMTEKRYLTSPRGLVETRQFLDNTGHIREQFSGDGYTYDFNGRRGMRESLIYNRPIAQLGEHALLDIDVRLP